MKHHRRSWCVLIGLLVVACHSKPESLQAPAATIPNDAIVKITENGPVKATVRIWPSKPTLDAELFVQLEVDSEAGVTVDLPFQEAGVGRFRVEHYERDSQRLANGHAVQLQTYTLVAPSSGRHRVPPFRIEMLDARTATTGSGSAAANEKKEVLTEEVSLQIAAVDISKSNADLRPAAGELDANVGQWPWWYYALGGMLVIWLVLGVVLIGRLRARKKIVRKLTAYDNAVSRLANLEASGAPASNSADPWFVELSSIVRRYLEDRYDIAAPDRTTEEFLVEAAKAPELTSDHRALLSAFLDRCDRVKFAGYQPEGEESLATLKAARGFVEDSRLRAEPAA
jgi:hypothetical protein